MINTPETKKETITQMPRIIQSKSKLKTWKR